MIEWTKFPVQENAYGHLKRLHWFLSYLDKTQRIVEVGCGTGYMITMPLTMLGYSVQGLDRDQASIAYGKNLFNRYGVDPEIIQTKNLEELDGRVDVVILSEVLEHIPDQEQARLFNSITAKLKPDGKLLITVPNGYGWFELESFLWHKARMGKLMTALRIESVFRRLKELLFGYRGDPNLSTLDASPHLQRFTYDSIQAHLRRHGLQIIEITGSAVFAGPFSNMVFTGIPLAMRVNNWLGTHLARRASAFFVACGWLGAEENMRIKRMPE